MVSTSSKLELLTCEAVYYYLGHYLSSKRNSIHRQGIFNEYEGTVQSQANKAVFEQISNWILPFANSNKA